MRGRGLVGVLLAVTACIRKGEYPCDVDADCGTDGRCEIGVGYCSFSDSSCASGRRFGEYSEQYSDQCVGGSTGFAPSNGVDPRAVDGTMAINIAMTGTINTDTGEITGVRNAGPGVVAGIRYEQRAPVEASGAPLGVFAFDRLMVTSTMLQVTGSRALVLIANDVQIIGNLDASAVMFDGVSGGGDGGRENMPATGCAGAPGMKPGGLGDSGGGGGGGGTAGAGGGATNNPAAAGGMGGTACLAMTLVPLAGGGGGGAGGAGPVMEAEGGGGGGAMQITSLGNLAVMGRILANGSGGRGGRGDSTDGGAGAGGGAGGGILLEAPTITISGTVVANGGGGGGGALFNDAQTGMPGQLGPGVALGGNGDGMGGDGGDGAAGSTNAMAGMAAGAGGGGGGGVGIIVVRTSSASLSGMFSPSPKQMNP